MQFGLNGKPMKKLFRIGSGMFIYSIIPILSWIVLSKIVGDGRIANVFSITYPIQFLYATFKFLFGSGANIRKEKEHNDSSVPNSMFWGVIFTSIIFLIPLIFVDNYIAFLGQDVEFYRIYVIYGIVLLYLQTLFSFIVEKWYFEDKEKLANIHLFSFNFITFAVLVVSALLISNPVIFVSVTLLILAIYIICLYAREFKKFKIKFEFYKNFKYSSANVVSSMFMFFIYLFGFKNAFSAGPEYVAALNLVGLCTDTQWDVLAAISTVAEVNISKNRFEYKKQLRDSFVYAIVVISTSFIMAISLSFVYETILKLVMIYLSFQVLDMFLYPYSEILSVFTQIEYSAKLNTAINFTFRLIRTLIAIFLVSPYCTDIGQAVQGISTFIALIIVRFSVYKIEDKKLIIKSKKLINEKSN